jgi:hypothetical protein
VEDGEEPVESDDEMADATDQEGGAADKPEVVDNSIARFELCVLSLPRRGIVRGRDQVQVRVGIGNVRASAAPFPSWFSRPPLLTQTQTTPLQHTHRLTAATANQCSRLR